MSKNYQRHYNTKTINSSFRNKNNYLRNINNSSYLYKENNNTKDSNAQSKDLYEDIAIDNAILLKKLTENKKIENHYKTHIQKKAPHYYIKKPINLKNFYENEEESDSKDEIIVSKANVDNKNYLYNNYMNNLISSNGNDKKVFQKIRYSTNVSNNPFSISNDLKKYNNKDDVSMKNLDTNIRSSLKISDYYQKVPYKKQLIHGNTPISSFNNTTNRKVYLHQNSKEDNGNVSYNINNQHIYRKSFKQHNTDINNKNLTNGSPFNIRGDSILSSCQKIFKFNENCQTNQTKLINNFIFHLYNYFYYYYTKIIKTFFLGLKNNNKCQKYDSSYKRFNNNFPKRIKVNRIEKADSFFTFSKGKYVLNNTFEGINSHNKLDNTYRNRKFSQNNLESNILKEKIRSNNQSVSPAKIGESEMYRNINELNKKYEAINNRKKFGLNIITNRKISNSVNDMNNSVDYDRKSNLSENKQKFDKNIEKIRQRSLNNKRKKDEYQKRKIAELHEKIMEKTRAINRLKQENIYNITNINTNYNINSNRNSYNNNIINNINKIKEKKIFDKKIIRKNNTNMITVKNITTTDKKICIRINYLNCIYPRIWTRRRKSHKLLICKEFSTRILGERNLNGTKNMRISNKLSEIKEEEEIKEELKYEISKYNKYLSKSLKNNNKFNNNN